MLTLYAHLDEVHVQVDDHLPSGAKLGTMGRTGLAHDRHLHFSLEFATPPKFDSLVARQNARGEIG